MTRWGAAFVVAVTLGAPSSVRASSLAGSANPSAGPSTPAPQQAEPAPAPQPRGEPAGPAVTAGDPPPQQAAQYFQAEQALRNAAAQCPQNAGCYLQHANYAHCQGRSLASGSSCGPPPTCDFTRPPCPVPTGGPGTGPPGAGGFTPQASPATAADLSAAAHERRAQEAIATGRGDAVAETMQAQMAHLTAQQYRAGNTQAAQIISNQATQATNVQGAVNAGAAAGMLVVDLIMQHDAEDEARARAERERLYAQQEQAEDLASAWRDFSNIAAQLRGHRDYAFFKRSGEWVAVASGGGPVDAEAQLHDLELPDANPQEIEAQKKAIDASRGKQRALQVEVDAFAAYQRRVGEACARLSTLPHESMPTERAKSPDVPDHCFQDAEAAQLQALAAGMKVGAPSRPPGAAPASAPGGLTFKPIGPTTPPQAPTPSASPGGLSLKPIH